MTFIGHICILGSDPGPASQPQASADTDQHEIVGGINDQIMKITIEHRLQLPIPGLCRLGHIPGKLLKDLYLLLRRVLAGPVEASLSGGRLFVPSPYNLSNLITFSP